MCPSPTPRSRWRTRRTPCSATPTPRCTRRSRWGRTASSSGGVSTLRRRRVADCRKRCEGVKTSSRRVAASAFRLLTSAFPAGSLIVSQRLRKHQSFALRRGLLPCAILEAGQAPESFTNKTPGGTSGEENHGRIHLDRRTKTDGEAAVEDEDHRPGQGACRNPRVGL